MIDRAQWLVNCSILFTELPLLERPAAAATAGFSTVEFWWPFPDPVPTSSELDAFVGAIEDAPVRLFALNMYGGDMAGGDRGILSSPRDIEAFRDNVDVVVDLVGRLGIRACNALYGNRQDGVDPEAQDECAIEQLSYAATALAACDAAVLLEPLSGVERYPLRIASDAIRIIDEVERSSFVTNVKLLADLYHLAVNGDDVALAIDRYRARIGHVQVADAPGRHEPGSGGLPLKRWIEALRAGSFSTPISLEYVPTTTSVESFRWMAEF